MMKIDTKGVALRVMLRETQDARPVIAKLCQLADQLAIAVIADVQGIETTCEPRNNPEAILHHWRIAADAGLKSCSQLLPNYHQAASEIGKRNGEGQAMTEVAPGSEMSRQAPEKVDISAAETLDGFAGAVLHQLFQNGPTWDGDIVDKSSRKALVEAGVAFRVNGWTALTARGIEDAMRMGFGEAKKTRVRVASGGNHL